MAKIKKISELEQLSSLSSSSNVIIEENGKAKRIAASKLVVSGSGEGGASVQSDWNQNDPTQPDYVNNRTHWEEGNQTVIEWDGSTEGREHVSSTAPDGGGTTDMYKLSDLTPTKEELLGGTIRYIHEGVTYERILTESDVPEIGGCILIGLFLGIFTKTTIEGDGVTISVPSTGCYALQNSQLNARLVSLTYGPYEIHKLDEKFIPDTIARVADIPEQKEITVNGVAPDENGNIEIKVSVEAPPVSGGVQADWNQNDDTRPDYVKNRTHWEEDNQTVIEWDGSTEGRDSYISDDGTGGFYKVSDLILTKEEVLGGTVRVMGNSKIMELALTEDNVFEIDGSLFVTESLVVFTKTSCTVEGVTIEVPTTGCYAMYASMPDYLIQFVSLTYGSNTVHQIDEKFIPDTIARAKDIPEVNYPVTSVNGMTGDVVIEIGATEQTQADWNQNDSAGSDYIKNRTHWEENSYEEILPEATLAMQETYGMMMGPVTLDHTKIVVGSIYRMVWDGVAYEAPSFEVLGSEGADLTIGNPSIVNAGEDNGIPFAGAFIRLDGVVQDTLIIVATDAETSHTLSISVKSNVIHKLDPKFLPEGGFGWEENNQTVIEWDGNTKGRESFNNPSGSLNTAYYKIADYTPMIDELIGGTITGCMSNADNVSVEILESSSSVENGLSLAEGMIYVVYEGNQMAVTPGIYALAQYIETVGVGEIVFYVSKLTYGSTTVHQIDEKFIPDSIARKTDVTWESLPDKPMNLSEDVEDELLFDGTFLFAAGAKENGLAPHYTSPFVGLTDKRLTVVFDGVRYECNVYHTTMGYAHEEMFYVGNILRAVPEYQGPVTNEPFCLAFNNGYKYHNDNQVKVYLVEPVVEDCFHRVQMYRSYSSVKFTENFALSIRGDFNENNPLSAGYIVNRPCYKAKDPISRVIIADEKRSYEASNIEGYYMADVKLSRIPVVGELYKVTCGDFSSTTAECKSAQGAMLGFGSSYIGNASILSKRYSSVKVEDTGESILILFEYNGKGTARIYTTVNSDVSSSSVMGASYIYHTLDEEYLPKNVVKAPKAKVGQTIVVKAIDYNTGKPSEWEAVDLPDVNIPKSEFVLSSPNGTNFRITIDDSGKLIVSNMDGDVIEQSSGNLPDSEEAEF